MQESKQESKIDVSVDPIRVRDAKYWVRLFARRRTNIIGLAIFLIMVFVALFAPFLAPYDPLRIDVPNRLQPVSRSHPMGTDNFGRDIFSRVIYGTRVSLGVGLAVVFFGGTFGILMGLLSGYFRSLDNVLMRLADAMISFPGILLAIAIMAVLGASTRNVIMALSIVQIPFYARLTRASVLVVREQPYVEAVIAAGGRSMKIIFKHVLPNCAAPLIVQSTLYFAGAVLSESGLSFLGLGSSPEMASWGNILSQGRNYMTQAPWMSIFPGLALVATVLALNMVGDGLRDILDPTLREA